MRQEIDPFTGLRLNTIGVTAPQRAANPFEQGPVISAPLPLEPVMNPEVEASLPKTGLVEGILFGLLGPPDSDLSKEKLAQREGNRKNAAALAQSASTNLGESFMQMGGGSYGTGGGGGAMESLGKIVKLFAAGGG